ncbi:MAG TPA: DUF4845 domain-containing protein [Gammaproteobacteria bacterium]|nr:DUF4845 domain-containing protein [Gammaproteobacteria bacterium]
MNIRKRQAGLTTITWILLILLIGFVALFGFKLAPVYMDYMTINAALTKVAQNTMSGASAASVASEIGKQFEVNDVNVIEPEDVKIGTDPNTNNMTLTLDYDARTGFIANVSLVAHFHKVYQVTAH